MESTIHGRALGLAAAVCVAALGGCDVAAEGGSAAGEAPSPGSMFLAPERVALADGGFATVERGTIYVPANREAPQSGVIALEVYRFPASEAAPADAPPLYRLYGGPTFQGLAGRLSNPGWYEREIAPYLDAAEMIVVSQRGIGPSKPTTVCERPEGVPADAAEEERVDAQRRAAARCRAYWTEHGLDLSGFTVLEAAADVDDVRRALGHDGIQLWGGSFGSHWAMTYMRAYPGVVRRAVLRGLEGVDHTYDDPGGVLNALTRIAAAADTSAALGDRIPGGGLLDALKGVIARLDAAPVTVRVEHDGERVPVVVDGDAVRAVAAAGAGPSWPARVLAMVEGDLTAPARAKLRRHLAPGYQTASYYMLDCGSGITPERAERYFNDPALAVVGDVNWGYRANCPAWDSDLGDEFRTNFRTDIPTVMVHGDWDTSTPLENARELAPYFEDLHFVLVRGGRHGALIQAMNAHPWFQDEIVRFFATGTVDGLPDEIEMPPVDWRDE